MKVKILYENKIYQYDNVVEIKEDSEYKTIVIITKTGWSEGTSSFSAKNIKNISIYNVDFQDINTTIAKTNRL